MIKKMKRKVMLYRVAVVLFAILTSGSLGAVEFGSLSGVIAIWQITISACSFLWFAFLLQLEKDRIDSCK